MNKLYITILAAGIGKRMKSNLPKVLHRVNRDTMIVKILRQVVLFNPDKIFIIVGKFKHQIQTEIEKNIIYDKIIYVNQEIPLGTGDAVKSSLMYFTKNNNIKNIILNGDVPLLHYQTIKEIYDYALQKNSKLLITSIESKNPTGCGRIILNKNGIFEEIIEEKDCNTEQKKIKLVNCGIYICDSNILLEFIPKINNNNVQKEYYLTDLVKLYKKENSLNVVDLFIMDTKKENEIYNINTKEQLDIVNIMELETVDLVASKNLC